MASCVLFMMVGCEGESFEARYPVRGTVVLDGKGVAEAVVVFHPVASQMRDPPKPIGFTDQEGRYELTTVQPRDGAVPGEYAITVELRAETIIGDEPVRDGPNLLAPRFADPRQSGFSFKVGPGENEVPPLVVQRP